MRFQEIDFTKGILIILMVMFHLTYNGTFMPQVVDPFVYSFHVSSFMVLSGFLFKPEKTRAKFWESYKYLLCIYLLFDLVDYFFVVTLGARFGSSGHLSLGLMDVVRVIFISPAGTYWYIHSLLWMYLLYWLIFRLKISDSAKIILLFVAVWMIDINNKFPWNVYFPIGVTLKAFNNNGGMKCFNISRLSFIPLVLIAIFNDSKSTLSLAGLATVLCFISFTMWISSKLSVIGNYITYIGKNTLGILLFSPFLTSIMRIIRPLFAFDETEVLYGMCCSAVIVSLSLLFAYIWDKIGLCKVTGRNLYSNYKG